MKSEKYFEDTVLSFTIGHRSCRLENTSLSTPVDSQSGLVLLLEDKPNPQLARSVTPPGVSPSGDLPSSPLLSELPQSEPSSSSSARQLFLPRRLTCPLPRGAPSPPLPLHPALPVYRDNWSASLGNLMTGPLVMRCSILIQYSAETICNYTSMCAIIY